MSAIVAILDEIAASNASDFTKITQSKVSENNITDTELDALVISTIESKYENELARTLIEEYKITMFILVKQTDTPLSDLEKKRSLIISNLWNSTTLNAIILKDSLIIESSTASNVVTVYEKGCSVMSTLKISCKAAQDY